MNTQAATAKAIDWKHVAVVLLRATWWLLKMVFKATVLLGTALLTVIAFFFSGPNDASDDEDEDNHWSDSDYDGPFPNGDYRSKTGTFKNNI